MYTILHASGALWRDTGVKYPDICWLKGKNVISPEDPLTIAPNSEGCAIWKKTDDPYSKKATDIWKGDESFKNAFFPEYRGKHV